MTRQEFLKSIWLRFFKPILIIGILAFLIRFFIYALDAESEERQFINLIGFGIIIGGVLTAVGVLLKYTSTLVVANTPDGIKMFFDRNSKRITITFNVILAIIYLYLAIKFIMEKEYWNLAGLVVAPASVFFQKKYRTRK